MKLYFKQRLFSWLDSYDIYDENHETVYKVEGQLSWGHCLKIFNSYQHVGTIKEEVLTFLPKCKMYINDEYVGSIKKEFTFFKSRFIVDCNNWQVTGDFFGFEYEVRDQNNHLIMKVSKELFRLTDTYVMDIADKQDALICLMIVLAIDIVACSKKAQVEVHS